ncbi:MAG TPA: M20/M25/M40 family metallo-hydrolase [Bacteroidales bacterium]|nr:M20/M25/M40 family metallo-hydrolase [Bacteroidales bacterium]
MKLINLKAAVFVLFLLPSLLLAQNENVDLAMIYKIKQEGLKYSQIEELAFGLTDLTGPRLTGSTGMTRGNEWAKKKMEELGFQNVRIEAACDFSKPGWDNLKTYAAMTAPYYANFACNPVAWTGSTNGLIKAEVVYVDINTEADMDKYKGKLSGKIVLLPSATQYEVNFDPLASRYIDAQLAEMAKRSEGRSGRRPRMDFAQYAAMRALRNKISEFLSNEGAAVILNGSGTFNVPRSNSVSYKKGEKEPVAQLNLPVEAHGRMERILKHNLPVEMEIEIQNKFFDSPTVYNVIGEIPGTDKTLKNEVVMIGAHIDSWHGGTGAADNASGCIVMMEALRILKAIDAAPKRTIRVALWGGEEEGFLGSRGYADKYLVDPKTKEHKPDYDKFAGYFNMDNGSGKYRGIYLQENDVIRPVFKEWMKPFEDMGVTTISPNNTGGTDHLTFNGLGLPGFQFIQDEIEYRRGYHTVMDTYERLVMEDLKHNAVITAAFAYNAAMRMAKIPAKPVMKPRPESERPRF